MKEKKETSVLCAFFYLCVISFLKNIRNFFFLFGRPVAYGVPRSGIRSKLQLQPCSNATHCAGPGIEPASWCCRDATNPMVSQGELQKYKELGK